MGGRDGSELRNPHPNSDPVFERRHSDSDEYLSPLETTMTRRSGGRRSESRPRSRSRRSRDDYDSDLLYRDSEVSDTKKPSLLDVVVHEDITPEMEAVSLSLRNFDDQLQKGGGAHLDIMENAQLKTL